MLQVEHETLQRDEHAARILFRQLVVEAAQDLVRLRDLPGQRAKHGHGDRHEERGWNPLSRHVAQRHDDAIVGDPQHFVKIAADLTGRLDDGVDVEAGAFRGGREVRGQDAHLDLAGDPRGPGPSLRERRRRTPWP